MCGLVGILRRDGEAADATRVDRMLAPMLHRGPDGRGRWAENEVALGHLRLSILDLSERAAQPIASAGGEGVLVYNGEVYNFRSLRSELEREGACFASSGDTEVVLQALVRWGPERAIPRFNGMFALAYFDRRTRELWLARDRLGIKPLYAAECAGELIFGSEPQALLAHPAMPCRPDRLAIASALLRGRQEARFTFFEGVAAIEPGSWWRVHRSGTERHRYYHVLDTLDVERLLSADPDQAVPRFEALLDESVRLHLASDVPLAAICSGGVDSSLIAACASRHLKDLRCYVADDASGRGEGRFAQRVTDHLGVHLTRVPVDRETHLRLWPEATLIEGHPLYNRSSVALLLLARACQADGVKVLLNGEGADELFGGYATQRRAHRALGLAGRASRSHSTPSDPGAGGASGACAPAASCYPGWMGSGTWGSRSSTATASCAASRWRRSSRRCAPPPTVPSWSAASTISTSRSTRCCAATTGWRWPPRSRCASPSSRTPSSISASICRSARSSGAARANGS